MIIFLCFIIAMAFLPWLSEDFTAHAASGKVKMTAYNDVIKVKNTVYCNGAKGIYKVKVKNGKVKSKKLLTKETSAYSMKKKGNYIYYIRGTNGTIFYLYRVNIKTGKKKELEYFQEQKYSGYVIKRKKIYYDDPAFVDGYGYKSRVMSMNLNGSSKKRSSVKPDLKVKESNKKAIL